MVYIVLKKRGRHIDFACNLNLVVVPFRRSLLTEGCHAFFLIVLKRVVSFKKVVPLE